MLIDVKETTPVLQNANSLYFKIIHIFFIIGMSEIMTLQCCAMQYFLFFLKLNLSSAQTAHFLGQKINVICC